MDPRTLAKEAKLTQARLKELLHYDPVTGLFTRRVTVSSSLAGTVVGNVSVRGYVRIMIDYESYFAHRLAWLYMTGEWPAEDLDHADRVRSNNRWLNLREATRQHNLQNSSVRTDNTSGLKGVGRHKNRWRAQIQHDGKNHYLGLYATKEAAHGAYLNAKRQMHRYLGEVDDNRS